MAELRLLAHTLESMQNEPTLNAPRSAKGPSVLPFAQHVGLQRGRYGGGSSTWSLEVAPHHINSTGVVHGGAVFSLADTAMGAALFSTLDETQICATIEIKINFFKPVMGGVLQCHAVTIHRGKTVANMEANVWLGELLVAKANGSFAIFQRKPAALA